MPEIISGTETSKKIQAELKEEVAALKAKGVNPALATILVGEDEASKVYVGQKIKTCEKLGIVSKHFPFPAISKGWCSSESNYFRRQAAGF